MTRSKRRLSIVFMLMAGGFASPLAAQNPDAEMS
jgi:hypothetical protein